MNRHPREPLTPEERELAQLTGRLGPHGEPSPALDAGILAAAHAAVVVEQSRKPKPRWPLAMGLAASMVLAVGVAWQLRPLQQVATVSEAPAVASEAADASTDAAAMPPEAAPQANLRELESGQEAFARTEATPSSPPAVQPPPMRVLKPAVGASATVPADTQRNRMPARPVDAYSAPSPASPPAPSPKPIAASVPPPPPAPPSMTTSAPKALVAQEPAPVESPMAFAAETDAAADMAVAEETSSQNVRAATTGQQTAARAERKAREAAATAKESTTLDRVEVTGSRLRRTDLQVPVSDDARLPVNDWLERVRTRYGLGDEEAARQSLLLFVKDHPRETVPDDLEPLLEP
jgi:hypothetical protein